MKTATLFRSAGGVSSRPTPLAFMETFHLPQKTTCSLQLDDNEQLHLSVSGGIAWVTLEGDPDDYALTESSPGRFTGPGRLVIESVEGDLLVRVSAACNKQAV